MLNRSIELNGAKAPMLELQHYCNENLPGAVVWSLM